MPQIVLARPKNLDRRAAHLARQEGRFEHEVAFRFPPEATPEQGDVDGHILGLEAELLGHLVADIARALHRRPNLAFAIGGARRGAGRLHRCMGQMRDVVLRRNRLRGRGERLLRVAVVAHDLARLARGRFELRFVGDRIVTGMRAVVPAELQRLAPLDRGPAIARDDRDPAQRLEFRRRRGALDDDNLLHARHLHRRRAVIGSKLAAHHRRPGDDGIFHARQFRVDAIDRAARGDVEEIDDLDVLLAEIAEGRLVLELDPIGGRRRQGAGLGGELAIAEFSARGLVDDLVVLRLDLGDIDAPAFGCGGFEHLPCRGAALPHRLDEMAQAARAVGVLVAVFLLVARRLPDAHPRPVGLQLVGDGHRQAGARPGAHLGAMRDDGDDAVGRDRDKDMGIAHHPARHLVGAGRKGGECRAGRQEFGGDDKAAGGDHSLQKAAAADVLDRGLDSGVDGAHVRLPWQPP